LNPSFSFAATEGGPWTSTEICASKFVDGS
jgi:hypothetical protein